MSSANTIDVNAQSVRRGNIPSIPIKTLLFLRIPLEKTGP